MKAIEPDADERQLIEAARRDPSRFAELYEANFDRVYAFIARRVPTREEAEDLTADVFRQALSSLPSFEWQGTPFAGWLLGIATHLIARRWQRAAKQTALPVEALESVGVPEQAERRAIFSQLTCILNVSSARNWSCLIAPTLRPSSCAISRMLR